MTKVWDGKYIKAPVKDSKLGNRLELAIHKKGFEIYQGSAIDYRLEDFAEKDSLKKNTGVSFPKYRLVYYHCNVYRDTYEGDYLLLLDKKPSDAFIRNLEKSPKWKNVAMVSTSVIMWQCPTIMAYMAQESKLTRTAEW